MKAIFLVCLLVVLVAVVHQTRATVDCSDPNSVRMQCGTACPAACGKKRPSICTAVCVCVLVKIRGGEHCWPSDAIKQ
ncbi:hypothetical protein JTE90_028320 [Oedothorax gibbosus]|uniref:Uncharacterized protein n=1 Tax=Oedothorax gibbosus TaxID=931172 RepID=A0AAV6V490_9ARAC|nr:hypothetical protein JTE90_028320 [Oedothorax gibbosus]